MLLIAVPFRDIGCEYRRRAWDRVRAHLTEFGPVTVVDDGGEPFARGASLNLAFATNEDVDVIVACDADILVPHAALSQSVELAVEAPGLVQPFDVLEYLNAEGRVQWRWNVSPHSPLLGGCNVVSRATWEQSGGWDDRFRGWGCEDIAFAHACEQVAPLRRLTATATHLYHPKGGDYAAEGTIARNGALLRELTQ